MTEQNIIDNAIAAYGEDFNCCYDYVAQAVNEKIKRDNNSDKCEYCIDLPQKYRGFGYAEYFEQREVDDIYEISIDVKFCPNCGRKIGDKK